MKKEELALAFANNTTKIDDIQCPRGCLNPGLYFGFIKGYEAAEKSGAHYILSCECDGLICKCGE